MAVNIPNIGDGRVGDFRIMAFTFGCSSDAEVQLDTNVQATGEFTYALVNLNEPNVFIKSVDLQVVSKLTTSTGTFVIGDGTDTDGYWTDTLLVGTTTSAVFNNMSTSVGYGAGKLYTAADTIDLVKGAAAASAISTSSLVKCRVSYIRGADTDLSPNT